MVSGNVGRVLTGYWGPPFKEEIQLVCDMIKVHWTDVSSSFGEQKFLLLCVVYVISFLAGMF